MNKLLFAIPLLWLSLVSAAFGLSAEAPVTPDTLDQQVYVFSLSTNLTNKGMAFHVTISAKSEDIFSDSNVGLQLVTRTQTTRSIEPYKPEIPVTVKKQNRLWTADFTLSPELLKNPNLCFIFTTYAHTTLNGKLVPMPSATFYELRIHDFVKP